MGQVQLISNCRGSNLMIEQWATFLNQPRWFAWRGFEDVPPNYGKM